MDDSRRDGRPNGNISRNNSLSGPSGLTHLDPASLEIDGAEVASFQLTRTLGEAMYTYAKMRDAENEKRAADGDYQKFSQYFEDQPKTKEALESRRTKVQKNLVQARAEYEKAAREAEPLLRGLTSPPRVHPPPPSVNDETIRQLVEREIKDRRLMTIYGFDDEIYKAQRKMEGKWTDDLRRELKGYALRGEHERLSSQVSALSVRQRQQSVSSDGSRELDHIVASNKRDIEHVRAEFASKTTEYHQEVNALKTQLSALQLKVNRHSTQPQVNSEVKPQDLAKVAAALEKAQEVINDQYVTIHEMQLHMNSILEGIRILNERIEEYDKRIEGVQESTKKFFTEVEAESNRRQNVIVQAFDSLHDKVVSEMNARVETQNPISPASVSGRFTPPRMDSPRSTIQPTFGMQGNVNVNQMQMQLDNQAKLINDIHVRYNTLQQQFASFQNINSSLPARVSQFLDEVTNRLAIFQREQVMFNDQIKTMEFALNNNFAMALTQHVQSTENNFHETALHMESVKKRFAEHRRMLDNLIVAWRETVTTTDQLNGKFESLKDFLSVKVIPSIKRVHTALPTLMEGIPPPTRSTVSPNTTTPDITVMQNPTTDQRRKSDSAGGGGASDPIELA